MILRGLSRHRPLPVPWIPRNRPEGHSTCDDCHHARREKWLTGVESSGVEIGVVLLLLSRIAEPKSKSHNLIGINESARSTRMFSGFKSLEKITNSLVDEANSYSSRPDRTYLCDMPLEWRKWRPLAISRTIKLASRSVKRPRFIIWLSNGPEREDERDKRNENWQRTTYRLPFSWRPNRSSHRLRGNRWCSECFHNHDNDNRYRSLWIHALDWDDALC